MIDMQPEANYVSSLDALASAGERWVWRSRLREGMRVCMSRGIVLLLVVPVLAIAVITLGWVIGQPWKLPVALVVLLCPVPTVLYLGWHLILFWRKRPNRSEGLALLDEKLGLEDRLQTADEFLAVEKPTPFMQAAIEDARPAIERASQQPLDWEYGKPWRESRRWLVVPVAAIALLVIAALLPISSRSRTIAEDPRLEPVQVADRLPLATENNRRTSVQAAKNTPEPKAERPEEPVRKGAKGEPGPSKVNENPSSRLAGREKISLGTSEGGQTSQATSSGRASQSSGMPGSQAPSSSPENRPEVKKKDTKSKEKKSAEPQRKKVEDQSGATAGRGSSSGSSRNPASTDWSSKDRTEAADNEEFEQEEDVDDEQSESEARGGLQPSLRDRRPPVNRDLSIGFGNRSSPDANGRGGPGQRKKSRGVASLVLGVPVPDHVKGQPNPGRVKINQERVQPQGEEMPQGIAEDRGRRSSPAGHLFERTLDASMRSIVREYFLETRASETPSTPIGTSNQASKFPPRLRETL